VREPGLRARPLFQLASQRRELRENIPAQLRRDRANPFLAANEPFQIIGMELA
jgi:hypothetical protein